MKKISCLFFSLFIFFSSYTQTIVNKPSTAFHAYRIMYEGKDTKILNGLISRSDIENDTSFSWFKKNYGLGRPDAGTVATFKKHATDFQLLIFCGTWCSDTQNLLPELYRLTDAAGYADSNITLIGVDTTKIALDNMSATFLIVDVPTFIVMKNGKEAGRVVEYGVSGEAMKELGQIVDGL
ncbi:MAG: thioredoxin family protein [Bacteroidetes bacterium]|nr:thioredoxin family protein [Bacteroidota bacterium]